MEKPKGKMTAARQKRTTEKENSWLYLKCLGYSFDYLFFKTANLTSPHPQRILTGGKSNPSGVGNNVLIPVAAAEKDNSCSDADAANKDADQWQHPFRRQVWAEADLGPVVQCCARPHQTQWSFTYTAKVWVNLSNILSTNKYSIYF